MRSGDVRTAAARAGVAVALGALLAGTVACRAPFEASAPSGFAAYEPRTKRTFRAVSPDGVVYRVRTVATDAEGADLAFWKEALRRHLKASGYEVLRDGDLGGGEDGYLLELTAPRGPDDVLYLVGLKVQDDDVLVLEAAGEVSRLESRRAEVLDAMRTARWR